MLFVFSEVCHKLIHLSKPKKCYFHAALSSSSFISKETLSLQQRITFQRACSFFDCVFESLGITTKQSSLRVKADFVQLADPKIKQVSSMMAILWWQSSVLQKKVGTCSFIRVSTLFL